MGASWSQSEAWQHLVTKNDVKNAVRGFEAWRKAQEELAAAGAVEDVDPATTSLLERVGGADQVRRVVEVFVRRMYADERLSGFLQNTDPVKLRAKQSAFLAWLFSPADQSCNSRHVRAAHLRLIKQRGFSPEHFQAGLDHLEAAMREMGVPEPAVKEAMSKLSPYQEMTFTPLARDIDEERRWAVEERLKQLQQQPQQQTPLSALALMLPQEQGQGQGQQPRPLSRQGSGMSARAFMAPQPQQGKQERSGAKLSRQGSTGKQHARLSRQDSTASGRMPPQHLQQQGKLPLSRQGSATSDRGAAQPPQLGRAEQQQSQLSRQWSTVSEKLLSQATQQQQPEPQQGQGQLSAPGAAQVAAQTRGGGEQGTQRRASWGPQPSPGAAHEREAGGEEGDSEDGWERWDDFPQPARQQQGAQYQQQQQQQGPPVSPPPHHHHHWPPPSPLSPSPPPPQSGQPQGQQSPAVRDPAGSGQADGITQHAAPRIAAWATNADPFTPTKRADPAPTTGPAVSVVGTGRVTPAAPGSPAVATVNPARTGIAAAAAAGVAAVVSSPAGTPIFQSPRSSAFTGGRPSHTTLNATSADASPGGLRAASPVQAGSTTAPDGPAAASWSSVPPPPPPHQVAAVAAGASVVPPAAASVTPGGAAPPPPPPLVRIPSLPATPAASFSAGGSFTIPTFSPAHHLPPPPHGRLPPLPPPPLPPPLPMTRSTPPSAAPSAHNTPRSSASNQYYVTTAAASTATTSPGAATPVPGAGGTSVSSHRGYASASQVPASGPVAPTTGGAASPAGSPAVARMAAAPVGTMGQANPPSPLPPPPLGFRST